MNTSERNPVFEQLFTESVMDRMGKLSYGDWRQLSAPGAVSLSYGYPFPESFPNEKLVSAAEELFDAEGDVALQYGGGEYADELAPIVADRIRDRGIDCDDDEVLITNGASSGIDTVCRTVLEPGDAVFTEAPTFMGTLALFRNFGVDIVPFDIDENGLDVDQLEVALRQREADGEDPPKIVYTIPNFQNPTGTTLTLERRERLVELAEEFGFLVIEDDAYGRLRYDGDDVPPLAAIDNSGRVAHVGTFSKTIAPGVRTGWVIADAAFLEQARPMFAGGANTLMEGVLARYCEAGYLEETVPKLREEYARRRDHMLDCLEREMPPAVDWTEPEGGFFVWVEIPDVDTNELLHDAGEEGVTYLPGQMFFPGDETANTLRLSFSHVSLEEMERGVAALGRTAVTALEET